LVVAALAFASADKREDTAQSLEKSEPTKAKPFFSPFLFPWWDPKTAGSAVDSATKAVGEATNKATDAVKSWWSNPAAWWMAWPMMMWMPWMWMWAWPWMWSWAWMWPWAWMWMWW
jgi:hypothetical protein